MFFKIVVIDSRKRWDARIYEISEGIAFIEFCKYLLNHLGISFPIKACAKIIHCNHSEVRIF